MHLKKNQLTTVNYFINWQDYNKLGCLSIKRLAIKLKHLTLILDPEPLVCTGVGVKCTAMLLDLKEENYNQFALMAVTPQR